MALLSGLEKGYKEFVEHLKLDQLDEVAIVPRKSYDLVIDCKNAPANLAKKIVEFLKEYDGYQNKTITLGA